ncbi:MAG: DUF4102 domain-containing protein [Burkholderiales bacterium]|nr:MAG: DUF4102 domain-containing protein [Burkholderiales bacterium]
MGTYPAITLAMARRARDDARLVLKADTDPVQAKTDRKAAEREKLDNNFEAVARAW